jgi:hypothetical protein
VQTILHEREATQVPTEMLQPGPISGSARMSARRRTRPDGPGAPPGYGRRARSARRPSVRPECPRAGQRHPPSHRGAHDLGRTGEISARPSGRADPAPALEALDDCQHPGGAPGDVEAVGTASVEILAPTQGA